MHDDLPCFDAADTRRGRPSVHKAFGEPLAVLTGDALIVLAFQCDLTRAVTIVYRHPGGGSSYFPWLPGLKGPGGMDDPNLYIENEHHEMSHAPATRRESTSTRTNDTPSCVT